jgi:hypothetical protein
MRMISIVSMRGTAPEGIDRIIGAVTGFSARLSMNSCGMLPCFR